MTDNHTQPAQDAEQREQARKERYLRQFWRQEESFYRNAGLHLTAQARADLIAIENEYEPLFDAANRAIIDASATKPDVTAFYHKIGSISPTLNPDAWKAAQQQATDAIKEWEANAPEEWRAAQLHLDAIITKYDDKRGAVYLATYKQQYEALGSEPGNIVHLAKAHVDWLIEDQYRDYQTIAKTSLSFSASDVVALGGDRWKLDATETRKRVLRALRDLHFRALGDNIQAIDEIKAYIDKAIKSSRHIAPEGTPGVHEKIVLNRRADKRKPEDEGIITSSGAYQVSITDKDYQFALTPYRNSNAYITPLREHIMQKLIFENGKLSVLDSDIAPAQLKEETANGMQDIKSLDLPLLRQVFTAVYRTAIKGDAHTITVHAPSFFRQMGIDVRSVPDLEEYRQGNNASSSQSKLNDVFGKLRQFENCIGVSKGTYYELLRAIVIDPQRNTITFATPYMNHIMREISEKNIERNRAGKYLYENPGYNMLMHSTITSERNKPAVEIVNRIMAGLLQRGGTADAALPQNKKKVMRNKTRVTYKITYNGLIKDIPNLYQTLKASTTADKNKQLNRAFTKAFELLRTKTDIFNYYVNLKISPEWAPTSSALSDTLTITHEGINGDYQPRE